MSTARRSLSELTLGDVGKALMRYRPFVLAVAAIILVVAFLPGKPSSSNVAAGSNSSRAGVTAGGGGSAAGAGGVSGSAGAGAGAGGVGASAGAGGTVSAGGGGGAGGSTVGGATGSVTAPVATTDPYCDQATGREMVPSLYAPPCVPPYDGNNGGATYNGVTATTINVAIPQTNNQAEAKALAAAANDTDTQQQVDQQRNDDFDLFEHHYQTYGRKVKWAYYTSSYNSGDSLAAQNAECQADATKVAEQMHAFASWGDCGTNAYENTLVKDGVLCFCTTTIPASYYLQWAPYVWGNGLPDETAGYDMRAEVLCNNLVPYAPQYAGEQDLNTPIKKQRVFGLIWPGASSLDDTDIYRGGAAYFAGLMQKCGANLKDDVSFPLIDPNGPADAQTLMSKFKNDGITTVIFVGDPIDPIYLTNAATKQAYFPEWFDSGSALIDTTHFGRLYDPNQWKHSFGISFLADRVPPTENDAYNMYEWQFHRAPPAQDGYGVMWPFPFWLFTGIQLAGPKLTPYTLQCGQPPYTTTTHTGPGDSSNGVPCVGKTYPGLFGYFGPSDWQSRVTNALEGWGDKFWPYDYYNIINDGTLIWWNGSASGPDETNNQGVGEQEFMLGGKRYVYGQFPKGNLPWFSTTSNPGPVTIFSSLPAPDVPPNYPNKCYYLCNSPGY